MARLSRHSVLMALALAGPACNATRLEQPDVEFTSGVYVVRLSDVARLEQRLSVMPAVPRPGGMLEIRSVLRNPTTQAIPATWSICGLHVQDLTPFTDPSFRCGGYSMNGALSSGDSVEDGRNLLAPAVEGDYVLQVRQLVDPSVWLTVTIPVRAP